MKQEFFNAMPDGTCRTIKANQAKVSAANLATQTARGATGVFVDLSYKQFNVTGIARCLKARYTAAPTNHACEDSGVLIGGDNMEIKGVANSTAPNVAVRAVCTPEYHEKHQNGRRIKDEGEPMFTLTAQDRHGVAIAYDEQNNTLRTDGTVGTLTTDGSSPKHNNRVIVGGNSVRIRRLTPRECWRLQGFPDEYFDKAKAAGISDSQLYKMAGNAVSVPVAKAIGLRLKEIENKYNSPNQ